MAASQHTTRRALFAAVPALSLLTVLPAAAAMQPTRRDTLIFTDALTLLHPDGRKIALGALSAGANPLELRGVQLGGGLTGPGLELRFYSPGKDHCRYFDLKGERGARFF